MVEQAVKMLQQTVKKMMAAQAPKTLLPGAPLGYCITSCDNGGFPTQFNTHACY